MLLSKKGAEGSVRIGRLGVAGLASFIVGFTTACPETEPQVTTADVAPDVSAQDGAGETAPDGAAPVELPETTAGCGSTTLFVQPDDPSARGPWRVGARTVTIGRLTVEVWYPVEPGAEDGFDAVRYDLRDQLPAEESGKIADADNPWQQCDCYRDAPLDTVRGPYPVVLFVHGTASFRTQSLSQMVHWASRGMVVMSADHPGLKLADTLSLLCPHESSGARDIAGDAVAMLDAVTTAAGELAFLESSVDTSRVGVAGHSAGGAAAAELAGLAGVRVVVPMASGTPAAASDTSEMTLFLAGNADGVVPVTSTVEGYDATAGAKRLVVLENAGHLAFSDLCSTTNAAGQDILTIAAEAGICGTEFGAVLFDCSPTLLDSAVGQVIVNHTTALVLEEHLQCRVWSSDPWSSLETTLSDIAEVRQSLE